MYNKEYMGVMVVLVEGIIVSGVVMGVCNY